jgi:putative methionine-R-sulfoxide reductase with GAF domain
MTGGADSPRDGAVDVRALRALLADAARLASGTEATAWRLDAAGDHVVAIANHGPTAALIEGEQIPARESVAGFVALTGMPMAIGPDDAQHPRIMERTGTVVSAMVVVPIQWNDDVIGALSVVNPVEGGRFAPAALSAIAPIAAQLGARLTAAP